MKDNRQLYDIKYPHYLPWDKLIWLVALGQVVKYKDQEYIIHQVLKSKMKGNKPRLVLESKSSAI